MDQRLSQAQIPSRYTRRGLGVPPPGARAHGVQMLPEILQQQWEAHQLVMCGLSKMTVKPEHHPECSPNAPRMGVEAHAPNGPQMRHAFLQNKNVRKRCGAGLRGALGHGAAVDGVGGARGPTRRV